MTRNAEPQFACQGKKVSKLDTVFVIMVWAAYQLQKERSLRLKLSKQVHQQKKDNPPLTWFEEEKQRKMGEFHIHVKLPSNTQINNCI